jgi:hypothetical protein
MCERTVGVLQSCCLSLRQKQHRCRLDALIRALVLFEVRECWMSFVATG